MRSYSTIPGELLSCFPGLFPGGGFPACICAAAGMAVAGSGGRLFGRCPAWGAAGHARGARTLVLRRPGRSCPALMGPAWLSGLARRGSRTWQVGKEPPRAEPGAGCGRKRARRVRTGRRSRGRPHASPQSHQVSGAPRVCGRTLCDDCAGVRGRADVPRCGRKEAVIVTPAAAAVRAGGVRARARRRTVRAGRVRWCRAGSPRRRCLRHTAGRPGGWSGR